MVPDSMRHVTFAAPGGPEVLTLAAAPVPQPRPGEVLIEVAYAGVNRPDCLQRAGAYPPPASASPILGLEVAGTVAACGVGVTRWTPGDRVCALTPGGGYAEYCVAPAEHCLPIPQGLALREAACLPEVHFTVWNNLVDRGRLAAGETVLIHGGTSGIGLTAIQVAKQRGATVIATAGGEAKAATCRQFGADLAIDYRTADFVAAVAEFTARRGVDVVLDMVGGDYVARNLRCLALEGRLVLIAFLRGSRVEVDWGPIMMKRLTVTGSTLRASPDARKAALARAVEENVWPLLASSAIRTVVHAEFPFAEAARAHALMESSQHIGKLVLAVGGR